jgi:hypothetical protein
MASVHHCVVPAKRTDDRVTRKGWIVERSNGVRKSHVSVLFQAEADAKKECERLDKLEHGSHA